MTTANCRKRVSRTQLGPYRRYELLTGQIMYPVLGYTGYGDGRSTNVGDYIGEEMIADWEANRDELLKFWQSGEIMTAKIFPDSKPWLFVCGSPDTVPWAATQFDKVDYDEDETPVRTD